MQHISKSENETKEFAKDFLLKYLNKKNKAFVVFLKGNLGAGKTTFTKYLAKELGTKETIVSPTYVIAKYYDIDFDNFKKLIHIDAYRLDNKEDLKKLGFQELLNNNENIIILEWPEIVPGLVEGEYTQINIEHIDENTRSFEVVTHD